MGKITYYLATSIDGYLAREDGSVSWLLPFQDSIEPPLDYVTFYATVSAVMMGRKTWDVVRSLEGLNPYPGLPKYIFTRQQAFDAEDTSRDITICNGDFTMTVETIKSAHPDRIWLVGGGEMAAQLVQAGLLEEIILTIVPMSLGRGLRWLAPHEVEARWRLTASYTTRSGVVQLVLIKED